MLFAPMVQLHGVPRKFPCAPVRGLERTGRIHGLARPGVGKKTLSDRWLQLVADLLVPRSNETGFL